MKYVALAFNAWDSIMAHTPVPLPVAPLGKSSGFMLVYDTLEALRDDHPDTQYVTIEPAE